MLRRFLRQPASRHLLLMEAAVCLLLARLALRVLSFRRLMRLFNRPMKGPEVVGAARERLRKEVCWAIERAATYLPGETVCFPRGIAAQVMLLQRRMGATLYYGAAILPERGLTAHVWVQDGEEGVVGHGTADRYKILAVYPETARTQGTASKKFALSRRND